MSALKRENIREVFLFLRRCSQNFASSAAKKYAYYGGGKFICVCLLLFLRKRLKRILLLANIR